QSPLGIGASLDGSRVVVSNEISASASIIDGVTASVLATVPFGTSPRGVGVTLDGAKAYVASWLEGISVLDLAAGTVVATLPVDGTPEAVIVSPSGHRAYVTKTLFDGTGTLLVIDT